MPAPGYLTRMSPPSSCLETGSRVVVTGGAGFVGSWLCERLLEDGVRVVCVDNFLTGSRANLEHLDDDPRLLVLEQDVSSRLLVTGRVDAVLHLASPASPVDYLRHPVETMLVGSQGTLHALLLAERTGARFLLASTSEVYGDPTVHPQPETYWGNVNPVGPRSVYDEAKRFAEALTSAFRRERRVDTAIARIFNTYGPRMRTGDGRAVPAFASQALAGEALTVAGTGEQTRSLCYVEDTVSGLLALLTSGCPGPVNIGGTDEITMLQLAEAVRDLAGSHSPVRFVDRPVDDPHVRRPDTAVAREQLGWRPTVSLREGLSRTLEWFAAAQPHPAPVGTSATASPR
jgi:dTDP-glucose 4,6-dehydratase